METIQAARAEAFRALHQRAGLFVIPNPWDAGSTKILTALGFEALATTSAGLAFSLGKPDGNGSVTREEALQNAKSIVAATSLPVAADLENGYGDSPSTCAETIHFAAEVGLVGGSIEDATGNPKDPIYPFDLAVQRVKAAVEVARSLPFPFMLTARAENLIHGRMDLKDTIHRLKAYAEAGANVLFAPGLSTMEEIEAVVKAVAPKPVNVLWRDDAFTFRDLEAWGVKRVSLGSTLARAAYGSLMQAGRELQRRDGIALGGVPTYAELNRLFGAR